MHNVMFKVKRDVVFWV